MQSSVDQLKQFERSAYKSKSKLIHTLKSLGEQNHDNVSQEEELLTHVHCGSGAGPMTAFLLVIIGGNTSCLSLSRF